jgi:tellurite resistance protein
MGQLAKLVAATSTAGADDLQPLAQTVLLVASIDGKVDTIEQTMIDTLFATVPQLKGQKQPERVTRRTLLDLLAALPSEPLRKQCYVLAVEVALASGHVNESEDQFVELIGQALKIDPAFARQAIEVVACKYARAR